MCSHNTGGQQLNGTERAWILDQREFQQLQAWPKASCAASCLMRGQLPQARPAAASSAASSCLKHGQLPQARPAAASSAASCLRRGQLRCDPRRIDVRLRVSCTGSHAHPRPGQRPCEHHSLVRPARASKRSHPQRTRAATRWHRVCMGLQPMRAPAASGSANSLMPGQLPHARPAASRAASYLKRGQQLPQARPAAACVASSFKFGQQPQAWPATSCAASCDATLGASMSVYK
ncbi:hypothetical protein Dimus_023963 [Dionaea muscipula]